MDYVVSGCKRINRMTDTERIDYKTVEPVRVLDYLTAEKANGNNVNPEDEAMKVLKIQMQYQLLSMMAGFQYNQVQSVLK